MMACITSNQAILLKEMGEADDPWVPEPVLEHADVALGLVPFGGGPSLVRVQVERRAITWIPNKGTVSLHGSWGSQVLDYLVLRPYRLRDADEEAGEASEATRATIARAAPRRWGGEAIREPVGLIQALYYPRDVTIA